MRPSLYVFILTLALNTSVFSFDVMDPVHSYRLTETLKHYYKTSEELRTSIESIAAETSGMTTTLAAIHQRKIINLTTKLLILDLALKTKFQGEKGDIFSRINFDLEMNVKQLTNSLVRLYVAYERYKILITTISPLWKKLKTRLMIREMEPITSIVLPWNGQVEFLKKPKTLEDVFYEVTSYENYTKLKLTLDDFNQLANILDPIDFGEQGYVEALQAAELNLGIINLEDHYHDFKEFHERVNPYQAIAGADPIISGGITASNWLSGLFGNFVGQFQSRKGYLFNNSLAIDEVKVTLKPLDILVERTPFALTDTFIPGNFGHAALYFGTEEQLKGIGLWDFLSPEIKMHIRNGRTIIEAVRPIVRMTTVENFMNIDELAIIRIAPNDINSILGSDPLRVFEIAYDQIGKRYDFTFNIELGQTIVCSELIYRAFETVRWPTGRNAGRNTISPDNIAEIVFQIGSPFELVRYLKAESNFSYTDHGLEGLKKVIFHKKNPYMEKYFTIVD